ncbi:tail fiber assembly protein [Escherichia coli]|nr:tail fiber assembly protein [Escherichia coli]EIY0395204.1 tail fiber assembly protein [Escherichia coli]MCA7609601.1 tail fiber assembly protein [Escherichia coli]MEB7198257.1 tail fiber assembly protein [Escherichia coli]
MKLLWSATNNAFIPVEMVDEYKKAGWVMDDLVEATDDILPFYGKAPAGKIRRVSESGMPEWGDVPAATEDELQEQAAAEKSRLKQNADSEIAWRQDAVDVGMATEEEAAALFEWKKYRVLLMRTDTSTAPDIEWPILK